MPIRWIGRALIALGLTVFVVTCGLLLFGDYMLITLAVIAGVVSVGGLFVLFLGFIPLPEGKAEDAQSGLRFMVAGWIGDFSSRLFLSLITFASLLFFVLVIRSVLTTVVPSGKAISTLADQAAVQQVVQKHLKEVLKSLPSSRVVGFENFEFDQVMKRSSISVMVDVTEGSGSAIHKYKVIIDSSGENVVEWKEIE